MKSSNFVLGIGLVLIGILFLFQNFGYVEINFREIWPFFVILGGLGFWLGFFGNRENSGLIMPGTILTTYGIMFLYCSYEGWFMMQIVWPFFLIGPGLGFFFMYLFGKHERDLLIPGSILTLLGFFFFLGKTGYFRFWPFLLIILGIVLLVKHQMAKSKETEI